MFPRFASAWSSLDFLSRLYEWLKLLPDKIDTPSHWTRDQLVELQYESITGKVEAQKSKWQEVCSFGFSFPPLHSN
jgi:hypothetical protein